MAPAWHGFGIGVTVNLEVGMGVELKAKQLDKM